MKKFALVLALVLVAAFTAQASDFTATGSYRAVGSKEDPGANAAVNKAFYQRFRVAFNWKVNDNVSTQLRGDFAEFMWGDGYRPDAGVDSIMIDRAFTTIKAGNMTLKVGQQAGSWGLGAMWSDQFAGVQADFDLNPVTLKLLYQKESEGGNNGEVATDINENDDDDVYGIALAYAADAFSGQLSWASLRSGSDSAAAAAARDQVTNGVSLYINVPLTDMLNFSAEGVYFSGDNGLTGAAARDYVGTQLFAVLNAKLTDTISGHVALVWADAADANETQVTCIQNDVTFHPIDFEGALTMDRGLVYGNLGMTNRTAFFEQATDRGAIGLVGGLKVAATDAVTLYGKLAYAEPNENDDVTQLDNVIAAIGSVDYAWMPAVTLSAGVAYVAPDYSDNRDDDPAVEWVCRLGVSF